MNFRKHYSSSNGFATILTLVGMLLVVVSLPFATKLVQQNQDNRSSATTIVDNETIPTATPTLIGTKYYFYNGSTCIQTGDSYPSLSLCSGNVRNTCYTNKDDCLKTHTATPTATPTTIPTATPTLIGTKYYFYNGSTCIQTGDSYPSLSLCSGNVRNTCYTSLSVCNIAPHTITPTPTSIPCSSTTCSSCNTAYFCSKADCYWENQMRVCASKPKENLPNPLCDGAITGTKKCSGMAVAQCTEKGWNFIEYCNDWKSEICIENKCQNKNDYKKNFTSCSSTPYLGYKTYGTNSCPEGYSCDRILEICKPIEKLAVKKAAGSSCDTDADCLSGYCDKAHGGSITNYVGKYCGDSSDKEQITEDYKIGGIELAVIATLTTGGVIASVGGPTTAAIMVTNWMAANPGIMSKIQTAGNILDITEYISGTIACAVNPNSILCQNLADDMAVPGMSGLADSAADVIDASVDAVVVANSAKKAADTLVDTTKAVVDISDDLITDTSKATRITSVLDPDSDSSIPLFTFTANKSFVPLDDTIETVRVYRGITAMDGVDPYDQVGNMARVIDRNKYSDAHTPRLTSPEILPTVIELANNPTPENYLKYIKLSEELGLNQYIIPIDNIPEYIRRETFADTLITLHRFSEQNLIGTSPYVATTTDLSIASQYGSTIIVADVPRTELVFSEFAEKGEILIKGQLSPEYIRGTIGDIDDTFSVFSFVDPIDKVDTLVTELLN